MIPSLTAAGARFYGMLGPLVHDDERYGWPAARLCDAAGAMLQGLDVIVQDSDTHPGWGILFDPDSCPLAWLPWLAGLYGATLPPGATEQEQREILRDLPQQQRGTVQNLIAGAQRTLTGTATVLVFERDTDAYHLSVVTRTSETPNSATTLAALIAQKPGGLVLTYAVQAGEVWDEAAATWDTAAGSWQDTLTTPV